MKTLTKRLVLSVAAALAICIGAKADGDAVKPAIEWRTVANGGSRLAWDYPVESYTSSGETNTIKILYKKDAHGKYTEGMMTSATQMRLDGWFFVRHSQAGQWSFKQAYDDYMGIAIDGDWLIQNTTYYDVATATWEATEGWHRFTIVCGDSYGDYGVYTQSLGWAIAVSIGGGVYEGFEDAVKFGDGVFSVDYKTATWKDYDGTFLYKDAYLFEGDVPSYDGPILKREGYVFTGWTPEMGPMTGDTEYTAVYATFEEYYADYVKISTPEQFESIRTGLTGKYVLTADIDLQNVQRYSLGEFSGILDGNGHAIRNLNIIKQDYDYGAALFKILKDGAVVRNLTLEGGKVQADNYYLGGIAGQVRSGGALIEDCTVDLDIVGGREQIGGIVGFVYQAGDVTIRRCRSFVNITASGNDVGGLVGRIYDANFLIEDSYSCGKIAANSNVGGLVGNKGDYTTLTIDNCYHKSFITGNSNSDGKLVGNGDSRATIIGAPTVIDTLPKGGIRVGVTGVGTGTASYDTTTGEIVATPAAGSFYAGQIGEIPEGEFNDVKVNVVFGKEIATVEDFNSITNDLSGVYRLTADIDLENVQRVPFGEFSGVLDGNGHAIRNLNIRRTDYGYGTALFQTLKNGAIVRNLALEGGTVRANNYQYPMGGIAGYVHGYDVLIEGCTVDLDIAGSSEVGGIVGYAEYAGSLTIRRCRSFANVTSTGSNAGGILGKLYDMTVLIEDSYSCGKIAANSNAGGIVGALSSNRLTLNNCYHRSTIIGNTRNDRRLVGEGDNYATITGGDPTVIDTLPTGGVRVSATGAGSGTAEYVNGEVVATPAPGSFYAVQLGEIPSGEFNDVKVQVVFGKEITTVADLNAIADELFGYYKLTADIDLQNVARSPFGEFRGVLDGDGHTISNINITHNGNAGLFSILNNATVRNLSLRGGKIVMNADNCVGGITGRVRGSNCAIEDCTVDLEIIAHSSYGAYAGGIVGTVESGCNVTLARCRSLCAITADDNYGDSSRVGGLVGNTDDAYLTIESSYAAGSVQGSSYNGGLIGYKTWTTAVISNSYWTAEVRGNYNTDTHTVGYGEGNCTIRDTPTILDGFTKNTFNVRTRGNGTGTASYDEATGEFTATPDEGSVFIRWEGLPPKEGDYNETTVWAVFGEPVATFEQFKAMNRIGFYVQTADIDMTGVTGFTEIPAWRYYGYYDGGNHEIRNMSSPGGWGLFTDLYQAEIKNLRLVNPQVGTESNGTKGTVARGVYSSYISNVHVEGGSVTGRDNNPTGGLVGEVNNGLVEDCSSSASVVSETTWGPGTGGFVGKTQGNATIRRCYATGAVTASGSGAGGFVGNANGGAISECYASGDVTSENQNAGGFVGYDNGGAKISDCFALGAVCATNGYAGGFIGYGYMVTCTNCFSVGEATVDSGNVGGLGTNNYLVKFSGCCWDTETSGLGTESGAGEVGRTTAQMQSGEAFEGWDETVWKFSEGLYPRLRAFIPKYTVTWLDDDGETLLGEELVEEYETPAYAGETPTKAATAKFTYTFAGWTPDLEPVESNTTYTATYDATVNEYTITWLDDDDSVIDTTDVAYGETPTHDAPTKEATVQYTYEFAGWDPQVVTVTGAATYKATYNATVNKYVVAFVDDGGTPISSDEYDYGTTADNIVKPADPTKAATAQYTYTFTGWSPGIATVTGDATYTATYSQTVNTYTITWKDHDGSSLGTDTLEYDAMPTHADPTRADDTYNTYTFLAWTPTVAKVTGDQTYTATYMAHSKWTGQGTTVEPYTLTTPERIKEIITLDGGSSQEIYVNVGNGITSESITANLPTGYAVRTTGTPGVVKVVKILEVVWYDDDGTVLRRDEVDAGDMPTYGGTPTKASTAQYDYTFAVWTPEIVEVTESASYTATYTETLRKYTITWLDADGSLIETTEVEYGEMPVHPRPISVYTFTGWSPTRVEVTGPATYKATYSHEVVLDNLDGDYTAADGDILTGETTHNVSIPGGVRVTVNGVSVTGAGGGTAGDPSFDENCETSMTKFVKGSDGNWTVTAFAELAAGTADGVEDMVTVYRGTSPDSVATPVTPSDVTTANAVKVEVTVQPTPGAAREFFRIDFGND